MTIQNNKFTISSLWQYFTSKKLAIWLISLMAFLAGLAMIIPQKTYNAQKYFDWAKNNESLSSVVEAIQIHQMFKSYLFLIIVLLFTLNLVCCTIEQLRKILKTFPKGKVGKWGSLIFHIGFIIIILGGLLSNYFSMSGYFKVSEGEVFQETHEGYIPESLKEAPFFDESTGHQGFQLMLKKQDRFLKGKQLDYTSSLVAIGEKGKDLVVNDIIEKGRPVHFQGITFYHKDSGYSPELIFRRGGKELGSTYVSLDTKEIKKSYHYRFAGDLDIFKSEGYLLKINYFPDLSIKNNKQYDYDSMEVKKSALYLEVLKNNQTIFKGLVKKGQWVKFDDFEVSLGNTVYWLGIDAIKDPGVNLIFLGFSVSLLGLIIFYGGRFKILERKSLICREEG